MGTTRPRSCITSHPRWSSRRCQVFFATMVSYAPETVTRRLQMEAEKPANQRMYTSTWDCVRSILRNEGTRGLYKGFWADVYRGVGAAVVLVVYDQAKRYVSS
mmetsp:Transcript_19397/g.35132  ORF Transcript_19397/g.35132 Transcript_19397/m.35132 type:complete len:103 (-) Transcript_19397:65-373(-)